MGSGGAANVEVEGGGIGTVAAGGNFGGQRGAAGAAKGLGTASAGEGIILAGGEKRNECNNRRAEACTKDGEE